METHVCEKSCYFLAREFIQRLFFVMWAEGWENYLCNSHWVSTEGYIFHAKNPDVLRTTEMYLLQLKDIHMNVCTYIPWILIGHNMIREWNIWISPYIRTVIRTDNKNATSIHLFSVNHELGIRSQPALTLYNIKNVSLKIELYLFRLEIKNNCRKKFKSKSIQQLPKSRQILQILSVADASKYYGRKAKLPSLGLLEFNLITPGFLNLSFDILLNLRLKFFP